MTSDESWSDRRVEHGTGGSLVTGLNVHQSRFQGAGGRLRSGTYRDDRRR